MNPADLVVADCSQILTCQGSIPKRKDSLQDIGVIEKGWIASYKGQVIFAGDENGFQKEVQPEADCLVIDGKGLTGLPGFVDPHTHLPFAGSREQEFLLRLQGYTYQQLAQKGMGIQTTVKATQEKNEEGLLRIRKLEVEMNLDVDEQDRPRVTRCLDIFENYCTVTQSVRKGTEVTVNVK